MKLNTVITIGYAFLWFAAFTTMMFFVGSGNWPVATFFLVCSLDANNRLNQRLSGESK